MAKSSKTIDLCPNCGSKQVNKVSWSNYYCSDCCVEIDSKTGKVYTIQWDGELVDYYENEFAELS